MSPPFEIRMPSSLDALSSLEEEVGQVASTLTLSEEEAYQLRVILEELFVNFVSYGEAPQGEMCFSMTPERDFLRIRICDDGIAFNPLSLATPDLNGSLDDRAVGGLGVFFVRHYCERASYERVDDRNVLSLEFRIAPRAR